MMDAEELLTEPVVEFFSRHISGDLEVAIEYKKGWARMVLLPDTAEVRKLIKKKVLSVDDYERVNKLAESSKVTGEHCCTPGCNNRADFIDRGRPLCDPCGEYESERTMRVREKHYTPPEIDIESKNPIGILFD